MAGTAAATAVVVRLEVGWVVAAWVVVARAVEVWAAVASVVVASVAVAWGARAAAMGGDGGGDGAEKMGRRRW